MTWWAWRKSRSAGTIWRWTILILTIRLPTRCLCNWPHIRLLRTLTCSPAVAVEEKTWCHPEKTTKMTIIQYIINNYRYITTNLFMRVEKCSLHSHKKLSKLKLKLLSIANSYIVAQNLFLGCIFLRFFFDFCFQTREKEIIKNMTIIFIVSYR